MSSACSLFPVPCSLLVDPNHHARLRLGNRFFGLLRAHLAQLSLIPIPGQVQSTLAAPVAGPVPFANRTVNAQRSSVVHLGIDQRQ